MAEVAVSPKARTRPVKIKKNQIPYAASVLVVIVIAGIVLGAQNPKLGLMWVFGSALGFVLQKSRFCFTASLRDPVLTGSTSLTRAVLIGLAVATAGFAAVQYSAFLKNPAVIPGNINPVGLHTAIGAAMFGIGMVIAGGCASGTLMRMGEGFMQQWIVIVAFIGGSVWAAHDFGWWEKAMIHNAPTVWLPNVIGWPAAVFGQLALLGFLYWLADWYDRRKNKAL
ncbi:YeeE/YedE thiosulfate transporter family protein [Neobacillus sp. SM06]|uniref:YeeE/YedE thiosulfate transporter family protein n=1 Tax=Neobacillus sp. SM06 TaxID=3422492 RepID=UPI003D2977EC